MTKKRLIRGKDWHAWAWKPGKGWPIPGRLFFWADVDRPSTNATETGKWVRVRFVEVKG